jgi:hypothetical protein
LGISGENSQIWGLITAEPNDPTALQTFEPEI